MPSWLWWFLEPFTIEHYKITAFDTFRAMLFIFICLAILFILYLSICFIYDKLNRLKIISKNRKNRLQK